MPLLLYCVAKSGVVAGDLPRGVAGSAVSRVGTNPLTAFVSREADSATWLQASLRASAVEFHNVLREVFKSAAIIPFRFPTIFESDAQLTKHLTERAGEYNSQLEKFADCVQMEVRASYGDDHISAGSGTEYLRGRQKALQEAEELQSGLKRILSTVCKDWRQHAGRNEIRAFALVSRDRVREFEDRIGGVSVAKQLRVRVSGPWPVSEFIEQKSCDGTIRQF